MPPAPNKLAVILDPRLRWLGKPDEVDEALEEARLSHGDGLLGAGPSPWARVLPRGRHDDVGRLSRTDEAHLLARSLLDEVGVPEPADASLQPPIGPLHLAQLLSHARDALALGHQLPGRFDRHRPEKPEHEENRDDLGAGS